MQSKYPDYFPKFLLLVLNHFFKPRSSQLNPTDKKSTGVNFETSDRFHAGFLGGINAWPSLHTSYKSPPIVCVCVCVGVCVYLYFAGFFLSSSCSRVKKNCIRLWYVHLGLASLVIHTYAYVPKLSRAKLAIMASDLPSYVSQLKNNI